MFQCANQPSLPIAFWICQFRLGGQFCNSRKAFEACMLWLNMMIMTMAMMMMMLMMIMTSKGVVQLTKWLPTYWCTIRVPWAAAVEGKQQAKSTDEDGDSLYEGCNHNNDDNNIDRLRWPCPLGRSSRGRNRPRVQLKMGMKCHYDDSLTDADNVVKEGYCPNTLYWVFKLFKLGRPNMLFVYFQPKLPKWMIFGKVSNSLWL